MLISKNKPNLNLINPKSIQLFSVAPNPIDLDNKMAEPQNILDMGNLESKIEKFGQQVFTIDGHSTRQISEILENRFMGDRPLCIVLDTVKGKGVSFMEHPEWHAKPQIKKNIIMH